MSGLLILLFGILVGILLFYLIFKLINRPIIAMAPSFCEADVLSILQSNEYVILEKQRSAPVIIYVNGKSHLVSTVADYILEKGNKKYFIKVEPSQIVDPLDPQTYRKLLELKSIYPAYGALLLDLQNKELFEIKFKFPKPEKDIFFSFAVSLLILAVIFWVVFLFTQLKLF